MRVDDRLLNFEGVEQSLDDVQRKFVGSIFEFYIPEKFEATPGKLTGLAGNQGVLNLFKDGKFSARGIAVDVRNLAIAREYPSVNLVVFGSSLYSLTRQAQRQWRRGVNENTFNFERLYGPSRGISPDVIYASAFKQHYATKAEVDKAIKDMKKDVPLALKPFVWMVSRDGYMMSLYYEDLFIGMFNREREFVGHSETETLGEEMIRELQLRSS